MRKALGVFTACAVVLVAACSSSAPDTSYNAPDMGTAEQLPSAGGVPSVGTYADGKALLMGALSTSNSLVTLAPGGGSIAEAGKATTINGNSHYTLAPHSGYPGLTVSGSFDVNAVNWPDTFTNGSTYDSSVTVIQKLTITADHVALPSSSSPTYTVSGKQICNANFSMKAKAPILHQLPSRVISRSEPAWRSRSSRPARASR